MIAMVVVDDDNGCVDVQLSLIHCCTSLSRKKRELSKKLIDGIVAERNKLKALKEQQEKVLDKNMENLIKEFDNEKSNAEAKIKEEIDGKLKKANETWS
uniref:Uncharacterized protein n=2 Tax=Octopus bimaculoides TaxID=37653 RepID=A0A0L8HIE1_OCTBM